MNICSVQSMKILVIWGYLAITNAYSAIPFTSCPEICQCEQTIINCQKNDLSILPSDINSNVISLDLSQNNFSKFPTLKSFEALEYLNMSHNKISTLMYTDLEGLENLKQLDLTYNLFRDWKDIHSSTFLKVQKLTFLDLSHNPLRSIPQYSNHLYIESLIILRLTNCSMRAIPVNIFNRLTNLRELHLADNPITEINETFQLNNLKFIDLSQCNLNYIGPNVFVGLTALETLLLNKNIHLKTFFSHSPSLLFLDLSECTLEVTPKGTLSTVTVLDLSGNFFKEIPNNSFINFPNLLTLNLSTNAITSVKDLAFRGLSEIKTIDLSFNKLTLINEKVFSLATTITRLNISHNYLSSIDTISSNSLLLLDASYCEIYEINKYTLVNMPNLISLSLSRNFLTSLPDSMNGRSLVLLDVSSCRIKSLTNKTFEEMFSLRQIDMSNNALTSIDPSYFPRAIAVSIEDNPWRCDCKKLKHMYEWLYTFGESQLDYLVCDSPEKFEGKSWRESCSSEWEPNTKKDNLWWYSVGIIILMILSVVAIVILKRLSKIKEDRLRQIEEARRADEREALRRMQRIQREIREEESRNAPDPREDRPPSYSEALLLPRLTASHPSLGGSAHSIASRQSVRASNPELAKKGRPRRKRRRRRSQLSSESRPMSRATTNSDSTDENNDDQQNTRSIPRLQVQRPTLESDF